VTAVAPILWYVSKAKVLGANYGAMAVLPWANSALEAPAFTVGQTVDTSFADLLIRPVDLGWHRQGADVTAGFQFYAPTGRYARGGDNIGKGMWTYEPFVGTTVYFDQKRTVSLATTAFWELHGDKKDTSTKVGQLLTLEGGLGKSFLGGGLILGAAYYASGSSPRTSWPSSSAAEPGVVDFPGKHQVFAFGPDVTLPVASTEALFTRQHPFWETGARETQGQRSW
jgi:hypothetical protein